MDVSAINRVGLGTADCECCQPSLGQDPVEAAQKLRRLWLALVLLLGFAAVEVAIAQISHSLALLAESVHMVSDGLALGVALLAAWIVQRPQSGQATFGYRRVELLAALVNGVGLVVLALWIGGEAIAQFNTEAVEILSRPMLLTAIVGFGINTLNASLLHHHSHHDLNVRGAFLHMVADAASSVGVVLAAIAIALWNWTWVDRAMGIAVAVIILVSAIPLIYQSVVILLEMAPTGIDVAAVRGHLLAVDTVSGVQQLHLWAIAPGQVLLAAHLHVSPTQAEGRDRLLQQLQRSLHDTFGIHQSYIQMTHPYSLNGSDTLNLSDKLTAIADDASTVGPYPSATAGSTRGTV